MESIAPSSASVSTWREKIVETGKKVRSQISSLVSVTTTKIEDAGDAVVSAIRSIEVDPLKESLGILHDWFTWFLASILGLKFTDTGKAFLSANNSVLKALFVIRFISFLITLLATLCQMHKRNIALLLLVFEGGASILAASLLSGPTLWISVTLWLCILVLLGCCCYPELNRWFENQNQEDPSLPIVT